MPLTPTDLKAIRTIVKDETKDLATREFVVDATSDLATKQDITDAVDEVAGVTNKAFAAVESRLTHIEDVLKFTAPKLSI